MRTPTTIQAGFWASKLAPDSKLWSLKYYVPVDDAIRATEPHFFRRADAPQFEGQSLGCFKEDRVDAVAGFFFKYESEIRKDVHELAAMPRGMECVAKGELFHQWITSLMFNAKNEDGSWRFPGLHT